MIRFALLAVVLAAVPARVTTRPMLLITHDGIGGVRLGMTVAEVEHRLGVTFAAGKYRDGLVGNICAPGLEGAMSARYKSGAARVDGVAFTAGVRTKEGIRPGSTLAALKRAYGRHLVLDNNPDYHDGDDDVVRVPHSRYDLDFIVEDGRVASIGINDPMVLEARCPAAATTLPAAPVVLSLDGPLWSEMSEVEARTALPTAAFLRTSGGSGSQLDMFVCAGATRGFGSFAGDQLLGVWFGSGVATDTGITVGSSVDDLERAYGSALVGRSGSDGTRGDFYYVYAPGPPPVAALGFGLDHGIVTQIGFGGRQNIDIFRPDAVVC